ncbi:hypothetical protein MTO96_033398 [Rhipicephalus appendiculatus]
MKFLEKINQRRGMVDDLEDLSDEDDGPDSVRDLQLESTRLPGNEEDKRSSREDVAATASETNTVKPSSIRRPQNTCEPSDEIFAQMQALLGHIAKGIQPGEPDDPTAHFGRYVASVMRRMSLPRQLTCQQDIIAVLQEYVVDN